MLSNSAFHPDPSCLHIIYSALVAIAGLGLIISGFVLNIYRYLLASKHWEKKNYCDIMLIADLSCYLCSHLLKSLTATELRTSLFPSQIKPDSKFKARDWCQQIQDLFFACFVKTQGTTTQQSCTFETSIIIE